MNNSIKKYKIAILIPNLESIGGLSTVARFIEDILQNSEYDYTLVSLSTSNNDLISSSIKRVRTWFKPLKAVLKTSNGRQYLHFGCYFSEIEFMRYMPRKILSDYLNEFDIVQIIAGSPAWAVTTLNVSKPVVLTTATLVGLERKALLRSKTNLLSYWRYFMTLITQNLENIGIRRANLIMVINKHMLKRLNKVGDKVRFGPPGVSLERFHSIDLLEGSVKYILSVGRLSDPRKNSALLFKSYRRLLDIYPTAPDLVLAGVEMPVSEDLSLVESLGLKGRVKMYEKVEESKLRELYQSATVFWLTSHEEGLGQVILEAMACGVPVVSTRCGGPESIIEDNIDGFLVDLDDSRAIAEKTTLLLDESYRANISEAAQKKIREEFSNEKTGLMYLAEYKKILNT